MIKCVSAALLALFLAAPAAAQNVEYRVLATTKTSSMEKEMNDAGAEGFRFIAVMGGETAGGNEVVVLMQRGGDVEGKYRYKLLATNRTGTMQKEMNDVAADGYDYVGQTMFETVFGGDEVVAIVERGALPESRYVYKLIATSRTSTLQKELAQLGREGYQALNLTLGKTTLGGDELVVIARKRRTP